MTLALPQECRLVEQAHEGWHVWIDTAGKPHATRVHPIDATGCGTTLEAPHITQMGHVIAAFEHAETCASCAAGAA